MLFLCAYVFIYADPDAEVVSLSPTTLLESDRYVCEICNQGFQRDQNLQMHRRRHKVPWKLLKRETQGQKKRVFVCPEPSCLHHDPCHALGDLVGIKKHFRRKHSNHKQWVCDKCSKGYAVQSDYKAHIKTCGTRGHSCDCGRVFSRFVCVLFPPYFKVSTFLSLSWFLCFWLLRFSPCSAIVFASITENQTTIINTYYYFTS